MKPTITNIATGHRHLLRPGSRDDEQRATWEAFLASPESNPPPDNAAGVTVEALPTEKPSKYTASWILRAPDGTPLAVVGVATSPRPGAGLWKTFFDMADNAGVEPEVSTEERPRHPWVAWFAYPNAQADEHFFLLEYLVSGLTLAWMAQAPMK